MKLKVQKWGNSLALRFPKALLDMLEIKRETIVDVVLKDGRIIITPCEKKELNLKSLISEITEENLHTEQFDIKPAGREIW